MSFGEPDYEERGSIKNGLEVAAKSVFTDEVLEFYRQDAQRKDMPCTDWILKIFRLKQ